MWMPDDVKNRRLDAVVEFPVENYPRAGATPRYAAAPLPARRGRRARRTPVRRRRTHLRRAFEYRADPADISMRVRKQDRIDVVDALPDQERHDNLLADRFGDRRAVCGLVALEPASQLIMKCVPMRCLKIRIPSP